MKVAIELKLKDEFSKHIKEASEVTIDFGEELQELLAAAKASSVGTERLGTEVANLGVGLQGLVASAEQSSHTTHELSQMLGALSNEMAQSRQVTTALAYAIGTMGEKAKPAEKQLSRFQKTVQSIGKSWENARRSAADMQHIADGIGKFAGAGRGAIQSLVGDSIQLEDALARVGAKTGTTGTKQWEAIANQARELGKTTTFTALEVAGAQDFLAQAGLNAQEVLAATPGMLNLSRVGALDLASAADIATNVLQGMNMSIDETGRVVDVLAKAAVTSNTSVEQLGTAMAYAAPGAAAAGVSLEETAAAIGALSDAGMQGSMAGTSIRGILSRLVPTGKAAQKQFKKLGIQVTDEAGNMRNFVDILEEMHEKTKDLSDADLTTFRNVVFGQRAGTAVQVLMDAAGSGKLRDSTGTLKSSKGEAERLSNEMIGPTQKAIIELQSAWAGLKDDLSQAFLPVLRDLMEDLKPIVASLTEWTSQNPDLVKSLAELAIKSVAIASAAGPVLRAFSLLRLAMVGPTGLTKAAFAANAALTAKGGLLGGLGKAGLVGALGTAAFYTGKWLAELTGLDSALAEMIKGEDQYTQDEADRASNISSIIDQAHELGMSDELRRATAGTRNADGTVDLEARRAAIEEFGRLMEAAQASSEDRGEQLQSLRRRLAESERAKLAEAAGPASMMLGDILTKLHERSMENGEVDVKIKVEAEGGAKVTATRARSEGVANGEVVLGAF